MNKIYNLEIDTSDMPSTQVTRKLSVRGDVGAEFLIIVVEAASIKYYDFKDAAFELTHNDEANNLRVTMSSTSFKTSIAFPSGGADYVVKLIALPGTEIEGDTNKNVISRNITQLGSLATITFTPATANTSSYATFPTSTSQAASSDSNVINFSWEISNTSSDANGFGLKLLDGHKSISDKQWYFEKTQTVDGQSGNPLEVKLDDTTDIGVGMVITGVSSGSLNGTPVVIEVQEDKVLVLNTDQDFADGITLTFKAFGTDRIQAATGLQIKFGEQFLTVEGDKITKTVRADGGVTEATDGSSTNIALNGTYGIAGGNTVHITGVGVDNTVQTTVNTISTPSSSAGVITVSRAQELEAGTTLNFKNTHQVISISGKITLNNHTTTNKSINLDIDQFIVPGTDGT